LRVYCCTSNTKRLYINTISAAISVSLLLICNLPSEQALASSSSPSLAGNDSESLITSAPGGSTNTANLTNAMTENLTSTLGNATEAFENATAGLTNATKALQNISGIPAAGPPLPIASTNASLVNNTSVISSIFENNLPTVFIIVIASIIGIPLVLDIILAYRRKPTGSTDSQNINRVVGMPDLYRSLMTFGIIVLVGTVVFYLLALITLNINNPTSPALQSLIDVLKSLGTILGTALATIIAFYFGTRATESATEKAVAATAAATAAATGKADAVGEKGPPKVLDTSPADGATEVPLSSLISATFSHEMNGQTINENTFIVRKEGVLNPIKGNISLSPDRKTAIFDSEPDLEPNTKYTAEINEEAKDLAGNALVSAKRWSFSTITTT
jgi:Bacterial Ig-like domain